MRQQTTLSHTDAQAALSAMQAECERRGKAVVMVVADAHGEQIAVLRLDGAPLPSLTIAMNKAFTAAREGKPTYDIGQKVRHPEKGFDIAYYGDPRFVGWGGGLPVVAASGEIVGSVAVSGLPQMDDIEIAKVGVAAILAAAATR
jgi:glc operon protein GlcG